MVCRVLFPILLLIPIIIFSQTTYLFRNALVFDGANAHENWDVVVQGNRITYAGPNAPDQTGAIVLDLDGYTLLPGLIEGHSHLFLHPYNETSWSDQVLKESFAERTIRAVHHANNTLMAGFTSVRDLGTEGGDYLDVGLKNAIDQGLTPGPRMQVAGRAIVATGSYGPKGFGPHVTVPIGAEEADGADLIRVVRDQIGHGVDVIKVYADYRWGLAGEAKPTFSLAELKDVVETAASSGRMVVAHASTIEGMHRAILAGVKTIEHGDHADEGIYDLMKKYEVALCPTLAASDAISQYQGWEKGTDPEPERIASKRQSFSLAIKKGVTICAGGDVGVFPHGDNVRELEIMAEYGMKSIEILRSATSVNARIFGMADLGNIRAGALADLIVVAGNPIENISGLRTIKVVMKDGKIYRNEILGNSPPLLKR